MRIITGSLKGRRLIAPAEGEWEIRPTSDRAREALFSILNAWPSGAFLDLFGGTGAVAVEAWSRGYDPVFCVEKNKNALALIKQNAKGTGVRILLNDVKKLDESDFQSLGFLFADPPYDLSVSLFECLAPTARSWMQPEGLMIWETSAKDDLPIVKGWEKKESRRYGACSFHFFIAR